jgi:hypothetical protein
MCHGKIMQFKSASFCISVPWARQPTILCANVQQSVTDASFGSGLLFPGTEDILAEDNVGIIAQDQVFLLLQE